MSNSDNDKLEQFFRKATHQPDIPFSEDDWKKLEARLDQIAPVPAPASAGAIAWKIGGAAMLLLLLSAGIWWFTDNYAIVPKAVQQGETILERSQDSDELGPLARDNNEEGKNVQSQGLLLPGTNVVKGLSPRNEASAPDEVMTRSEIDFAAVNPGSAKVENSNDFNSDNSSPGVAEEDMKQKAVATLPGAEEEEEREVEMFSVEEPVVKQEQDGSSPRLSLLLSFAPDFSGTSLSHYSAPGKAFGATLIYHFAPRWSVGVGIIRNEKKYTSPGGDYNISPYYWKYYTNGVTPETIDGSCGILEFPIMVRYTLFSSGKNNWVVGTGMSSYFMQDESYVYNFDQPNPGARTGWASKEDSKVMFNMVNFSLGYERRLGRNVRLGVEPYAKIPLSEIGWSNIKLFSTGISATLRYTILHSARTPSGKIRSPE